MTLFRHSVIASTLALMMSLGVDGSAASVAHALDQNRPAQEHTTESPERQSVTGAWWTAQPRDLTLVERTNQQFIPDFVSAFTLLGSNLTATSAWQVSVNGGTTWADLAGTSRPFSPGGHAITLTLPDVWWPMNGNMYRSVVRVSEGSVFYSNAATLTVLPGQIAINANPQGQTVAEGGTAAFTARHGGASAPAEVRWQRSDDQVTWTEIEGTRAPIEFNTESRYELEAPFALDGTFYRAVFTNARTEAATNPARLTVTPLLPVLSQSPVSQTVSEGQGVAFESAYSGTDAQTAATWEQSSDDGATWTDVPGASAPTLTFDNVTLDMDGRQYRVRFSNASGSVWSAPATLTVAVARPVITEHPVSTAVAPGFSAEFSASYGGTDAETTVQWQYSTDGGATFNDVPANVGPNGAQAIPLIIDSVTPEMDRWQYRVRFTNSAGSALSNPATLTMAAVWPEALGQATAGGQIEMRIYTSDPDKVRPGVMEVTAPTGTRIVGARTNGNFTMIVSEDGRTAVSSRTVYGWGHSGPGAWVTLQVDPEVSAGDLLMDGIAEIRLDGQLRAVMKLGVEVLGAPEITEHPSRVTAFAGQEVVFSASAVGHPAPAVQWQVSNSGGQSWSDVPGATDSSLRIDAIAADMDGLLYRAAFTNAAGTAVTDAASLTVREVRYLHVAIAPTVRLVDSL